MMRSRSAQVKIIHLLRLINICIIFNCALIGPFTCMISETIYMSYRKNETNMGVLSVDGL